MKKNICVECDKPIRKNSKSPYIHRFCWLKLREKDERYLDFLFCKDKTDKKKTVSVKTIDAIKEDEGDLLEEAIEDIKDIINAEKPPDYELDKNITYAVDVGGNTILI